MYEAAAVHRDLVEKQEQHKNMVLIQDQFNKSRAPTGPDSEHLGMKGEESFIRQGK